MIFISYKHIDKPVVKHFAAKLLEAYGPDKVFYDEWSIQPGDGTIDKMNSGLDRCKFFFFFVTEAALKSNMVKLEWQNMLCKAANNDDIKFVPVRLTPCEFPTILLQTLYIDAYNFGFDIALRQMYDVIEGRNTYRKTDDKFHNLTCNIIWKSSSSCDIEFRATAFMESTSQYVVALSNDLSDIAFKCTSDAMFMNGLTPNGITKNGITYNCALFAANRATTPDNPFSIHMETKSKNPLNITAICHCPGPQKIIGIPVTEYKNYMSMSL